MQNEAQYDLNRKTVKISALSALSALKIQVLSQVLLNQLNLGILHWVKFLIKGWMEIIKKKGYFKRLKNIADKNGKQLKAIEDHGEKNKQIQIQNH